MKTTLKSEDAQAAAAAVTNKAMKRLISLALTLIFAIGMTACAPNNVLSPDTPDKPEDTHTEAPTPDNNEQTPDNNEQTPEVPEDDGYVIAGKEKNNKLMPTIDIETLGIAPVTVSDLKDKTLTIYTAERTAFNVDKLDDKEWIDAVAEEIGLNVKQFMRSDKTLYSAQAIAQKSGMSLDIVSTLISDVVPTRQLMKNAFELTDEAGDMPFSKRVYTLSGGKVFTGLGNSKMMWYNKDIVSDKKAYDLFEQGVWNTEALATLSTEIKKADKNMIECSNWASFASAGGTQITGLGEDGTVYCAIDDELSINTLKTFSELLNTVSTDKKTFKNSNTAFCYTDAPEAPKAELGFVPIPSYKNGKNITELCGVGMGVSKTADDLQSQYALTFILLWSARYSEARADALVFDYKLSEEKAEKYIGFAETEGGLYNADRVLSTHFTKQTIPEALYSSPEEILEKYADAFVRADVINSRNQ